MAVRYDDRVVDMISDSVKQDSFYNCAIGCGMRYALIIVLDSSVFVIRKFRKFKRVDGRRFENRYRHNVSEK